jgi:hypothetical protein
MLITIIMVYNIFIITFNMFKSVSVIIVYNNININFII